MGKKSHSGASDDLVKREPELQAVLLADSFSRTFAPLSSEQSKVLCPINNVTMLDYALEFLAGAGVHQVIVVCTRDDVEQHLETVKLTGELSVVVLKDSSLTNAGDALREVDKRNLIQSNPFLLMGGDVVTNVDLTQVIKQHKQRFKQDNSCIMTVLFQKVGPDSKLRSPSSDLIVGMDPTRDNRMLVYDDRSSRSKTTIPCSFFSSHSQVELHNDLLNVGLYICSPQVLARFSDEFDYGHVGKDFIYYTVAEEEEGLQQKLFAHVLPKQEYAACISDYRSYHQVSHDLLKRWCYPVVPDNLPNGYETTFRYQLQRHYLYKEQRQPTKIGPSTTVVGPGMVGSNNTIGSDCNIASTVIGHDCWIGDKVTLRQVHVWNDVTIEQGATVVQSILATDVIIKEGATISKGCIIGSGCVIGANVVLPEYTRITKCIEADGDDDGFGAFDDDSSQDWSTEDIDGDDDSSSEEKPQDGTTDTSDHAIVGEDGIGRVWKPSLGMDDDDDQDEQVVDPLELVKAQSIGYDTSEWFRTRCAQHLPEDTDDLSDDDDDNDSLVDANFTSDFDDTLTFSASNAVDEHVIGRQRGVDVVKELKDICLEHSNGAIENLAIELNSFKFSQNASYADCTMAAMLAVLEKMQIDESMSAGKLVAALKTQLNEWGPLFQKMSIGMEEEKSIVAALETAATGERVVATVLSKEPAFRFLLQTLHDEEVVSEEAILSWATERRQEGSDSPRGKLFQQQPTQDFLEWLEEESDDEDDESSGEDESE